MQWAGLLRALTPRQKLSNQKNVLLLCDCCKEYGAEKQNSFSFQGVLPEIWTLPTIQNTPCIFFRLNIKPLFSTSLKGCLIYRIRRVDHMPPCKRKRAAPSPTGNAPRSTQRWTALTAKAYTNIQAGVLGHLMRLRNKTGAKQMAEWLSWCPWWVWASKMQMGGA